MKKVITIGSGISGLSISRMLSNRYQTEILEREDRIGGMIKCDRINGNLFHKVGGHVFNSRNQAVLDWFWNQFNRDDEFLKTQRNAKIFMTGKKIGYPIENYLYQLTESQLKPIVDELLQKLSIKNNQITDYKNFKEFLIGNFGSELYNLYFGPYNTKIWNTDLEKVPLAWLNGKLPMPDLNEVIYNNIIRKEESNMVHSSFFYAKRDGSQFIVDRLSNGLEISCSYNVSSIEQLNNKQLSINNQDRLADSIVYCGDIRQLHRTIQIADALLKEALLKVADLPSNGTSNVFCETDTNDLSWLYLPESTYKAHRIIYTGNFSSTNSEGSKRTTCVVEFSGKQEQSEMLEELKLLPGNLTALAFNYEPNSYIIQNETTRADILNLKTLLKPYNIYLLGRFAEWEYYNMDKCIEAAMALTKKEFST
ncbi:MAG: NAD(P)-binding protein [Prolixibacteraceae bacterium]|nr:NAD(P)-binding protein [Prolixibacteraceae bacterium]